MPTSQATASAHNQPDASVTIVSGRSRLFIQTCITARGHADRVLPEMLAFIFKWTQEKPNHAFDECLADQYTECMNDCIAFSQVSRYWRNVALSNPTLWADH